MNIHTSSVCLCLLHKLNATMISIAKTVVPKRISSKVWQYFADDKDGEYASCLLCKYHPSNGVTIFVGWFVPIYHMYISK